jgi:hypothetical protein
MVFERLAKRLQAATNHKFATTESWLWVVYCLSVTLSWVVLDMQLVHHDFSRLWTLILVIAGLSAFYSLIRLDRLP